MTGSNHPKSLDIRPYRSGDHAGVIRLWQDCGLIVPHNDPDRDIQRKLQVNPEWFLVAQSDNLLVGSCMVGYDGHRGWLNYLAVAPEYQGAGIGGKLLARAEQLLRAAGCPKVNVQVRKTRALVQEFYQSHGYHEDAVISLGKRLVHDD